MTLARDVRSMTDELAITNELLRSTATTTKPDPAPVYRDHFQDLSNAPLIAVLALRDHLKVVPADYWKVGHLTRRVTIACQCRRAHRIPELTWHQCGGCGRTFIWTGRKVLAAPAE